MYVYIYIYILLYMYIYIYILVIYIYIHNQLRLGYNPIRNPITTHQSRVNGGSRSHHPFQRSRPEWWFRHVVSSKNGNVTNVY